MPKTLPQFKNIADLKTTPRSSVILYCTKQQWERLTSGKKRGKKLERNQPAIRFDPAPWGGGDIILFPVIPALYNLTSISACTWRFRRVNNGWVIELICFTVPWTPVPSTPRCERIVLPTGVELGCRPVQNRCRGTCNDVFVPDPNGIGGFFQCQCQSL
jgi:hypothetical protein